MHTAILSGNLRVHHWCRVSWNNHLMPYQRELSVLKVKYEDLLNEPVTECKRIVEFLGLDSNMVRIQQAIYNQSFSKVKKNALKVKDLRKATFLRKGEQEQWREVLSNRENRRYIKQLGSELKELGYKIY